MSIGTLRAKYVEEALIPIEAINGDSLGQFRTKDDVIVTLKFISGINNKDQYWFSFLSDYCLRNYKIGFDKYESEWRWRLDRELSDFWYIVRIEKI